LFFSSLGVVFGEIIKVNTVIRQAISGTRKHHLHIVKDTITKAPANGRLAK